MTPEKEKAIAGFSPRFISNRKWGSGILGRSSWCFGQQNGAGFWWRVKCHQHGRWCPRLACREQWHRKKNCWNPGKICHVNRGRWVYTGRLQINFSTWSAEFQIPVLIILHPWIEFARVSLLTIKFQIFAFSSFISCRMQKYLVALPKNGNRRQVHHMIRCRLLGSIVYLEAGQKLSLIRIWQEHKMVWNINKMFFLGGVKKKTHFFLKAKAAQNCLSCPEIVPFFYGGGRWGLGDEQTSTAVIFKWMWR